MEFLIFTVTVVLVVALFIVVVTRAFDKTERGWQVAEQSHKRMEAMLLSQNSSLHNRILSRTWQEYTELQHAPDDLSKVSYAEAMTHEAQNFGALASDIVNRQAQEQGDDLEGNNFEGPTVG
jgi:hypothetical protein